MEDGLRLPPTVELRLICPDVLVAKGICPWGKDLIEEAEEIGRFSQSSQIDTHTSTAYTNTNRSSYSCRVSTGIDARWRPFEEGLVKVFHSSFIGYRSYNPHTTASDDTGYELLRYGPGQKFGVHTDVVAGREEGFRILSAVCYLNDNYTGGELWFPRQQVKIRPEAGDVVLFPSNFCYPHSSIPVIEGTKYAVVTWFVFRPRPKKRGKLNEKAAAVPDAVGRMLLQHGR